MRFVPRRKRSLLSAYWVTRSHTEQSRTLRAPKVTSRGSDSMRESKSNGKRLALLKQAIPSASRIAFLTLPADWDGAGGLDVRRAAERIGVTVVGSSPRDGSETALRDVFVTALADGVNGLAVSASGEWLPRRETIVQLAREYRVPAMYPYRDFVEVGGLMAYTPDLRETATHLADAVAQVLRGKHPRDIPIQQATKFSLVLNLVAARELGTAVSAVVLAQ